MNYVNYIIPVVYPCYTIGISTIAPNHHVIPFPQINYTQVYLDNNQNEAEKKPICEDDDEEVKEETNKEKTKRRRKLFTKEEDEKIKKLTEKYGTKQWNLIATFVEGRTPKQCRDRYCNYLFPGIFSGEWSIEEDELLIKLYKRYGPRWTVLQRSFPYRSANTIKNRWDFFLCRHNNQNDKNRRELSSSCMKPNHEIIEKENYEEQSHDHNVKNNELDNTNIDSSFGSKDDDYSNFFENNLNDESFELAQNDNIYELSNGWYEFF